MRQQHSIIECERVIQEITRRGYHVVVKPKQEDEYLFSIHWFAPPKDTGHKHIAPTGPLEHLPLDKSQKQSNKR